MKWSACVEWLFEDETEDVAERIRRSGENGFDSVEFWLWSNKDIDAIELAAKKANVEINGFVAEPMIGLNETRNHAAFLEGLDRSIEIAQRLQARTLIAQAGNEVDGIPRNQQIVNLMACLSQCANRLKGSGIRLGVEPLNTLVDHPGYLLSSTRETLDIVDMVGRSEIGIVYDIYHSAVMGEDTARVLDGAIEHVFHVHVADHPGRGAPGSGSIDIKARLEWLLAQGYDGSIGFEYKPVDPTAQDLPQVFAALAVSDKANK